MTAFHDNFHYYRLAIVRIVNTAELHIIRRQGGVEEILYMKDLGPIEKLAGLELGFAIEQRDQELRFNLDSTELTKLYDARILSPDVASGFVGTLLGAYIQWDQDMYFIGKDDESAYVQNRPDRQYLDTSWLLRDFDYSGKDESSLP